MSKTDSWKDPGTVIIVYKCPNGHTKKWKDPGGGCMVRQRTICGRCGKWAQRQD